MIDTPIGDAVSFCLCLASPACLPIPVAETAADGVFAAQTETQVSRSAINLAASGLEVTIHTEVLYSTVLPDAVVAALKDAGEADFDLAVEATFADAQGRLVLKIDREEFPALHVKDVSTDVATFYVDGEIMVDGAPEPVQGEDAARIINVGK